MAHVGFALLLDCYLCNDCDGGELLKCGNFSHQVCSVVICFGNKLVTKEIYAYNLILGTQDTENNVLCNTNTMKYPFSPPLSVTQAFGCTPADFAHSPILLCILFSFYYHYLPILFWLLRVNQEPNERTAYCLIRGSIDYVRTIVP